MFSDEMMAAATRIVIVANPVIVHVVIFRVLQLPTHLSLHLVSKQRSMPDYQDLARKPHT